MRTATQKKNFSTILERIAEKDQTAVKNCVDTYGNFIWTLAKNFTNSTEAAETATRKIFIDIWRYAEQSNEIPADEQSVIARIALRRLIKYPQ